MQTTERPNFDAEQMAYWFFRLNGCMNIVNFLVHHGRGALQATDVDVLAVRFPHRSELALSGRPMNDHAVFKGGGQIDIILAEVKTGLCDLNGPWTKRESQNMHRVLFAVGAFPKYHVPIVADALYEDQFYADDRFRVRLFALGKRTNPELSPEVVQLTWEEILTFIYARFRRYLRVKAQHGQWPHYGQQLYENVGGCPSAKEFVAAYLS